MNGYLEIVIISLFTHVCWSQNPFNMVYSLDSSFQERFIYAMPEENNLFIVGDRKLNADPIEKVFCTKISYSGEFLQSNELSIDTLYGVRLFKRPIIWVEPGIYIIVCYILDSSNAITPAIAEIDLNNCEILKIKEFPRSSYGFELMNIEKDSFISLLFYSFDGFQTTTNIVELTTEFEERSIITNVELGLWAPFRHKKINNETVEVVGNAIEDLIDPNEPFYIFYRALDGSGTTTTSKSYEPHVSTSLSDLESNTILTSERGYIILYDNVVRFDTGRFLKNNFPNVALIAKNFESVIWETPLITAIDKSSPQYTKSDVCWSKDSLHIYCVGEISEHKTMGSDFALLVTKLNLDGTVEWQKKYPVGDSCNQKHIEAFTIANTKFNGIVVTGTVNCDTMGIRGFVVQLDENGCDDPKCVLISTDAPNEAGCTLSFVDNGESLCVREELSGLKDIKVFSQDGRLVYHSVGPSSCFASRLMTAGIYIVIVQVEGSLCQGTIIVHKT